MIHNAVTDCILSRRSTRRFEDKQIEDEQLETLLTAAVWAPSGSNSQSWLFTAVQNRSYLDKINDLVREGFQHWVPDDDYPGKLGAKNNAQKEDYHFFITRLRSSLPPTARIMKTQWRTARLRWKISFWRRSRSDWEAAI